MPSKKWVKKNWSKRVGLKNVRRKKKICCNVFKNGGLWNDWCDKAIRARWAGMVEVVFCQNCICSFVFILSDARVPAVYLFGLGGAF